MQGLLCGIVSICNVTSASLSPASAYNVQVLPNTYNAQDQFGRSAWRMVSAATQSGTGARLLSGSMDGHRNFSRIELYFCHR